MSIHSFVHPILFFAIPTDVILSPIAWQAVRFTQMPKTLKICKAMDLMKDGPTRASYLTAAGTTVCGTYSSSP